MLQASVDEKIKSIQSKFQFLAALTLFFPVTLSAVFSNFENTIKSNYQTMSWGGVVAVLVSNYLLIEYLKDKMPSVVARYADLLLTIAILCYVPVFVTFAMYNQTMIPYLDAVVFGIGIAGTVVIPGLIFCLLTATVVYVQNKEPYDWISGRLISFIKKMSRK